MNTVLLLLALFFVLRLVTLCISILNERRLKEEGAIEFGKKNSLILSALHVLFYISSAYVAWKEDIQLDYIGYIGICLFIFSYVILLYVIYQLRKVWTIKLYIAKKHDVNHSFLFRYVRHPNYFLNIIPELIGIGLLCHSWIAMSCILPFYLISLFVRIKQEEQAMSHLFAQDNSLR